MGKTVAVIKGDDTGPEVVNSMKKVLTECNSDIEFVTCEAGYEYWKKNGGDSYFADNAMEIIKKSNACFKGGTTTDRRIGTPKSVVITLRQKFELYSNVRPIKSYHSLSPGRNLDFVCFREATEGFIGGTEYQLSDEGSILIRKTTKKGCYRFVKSCFEWAEKNDLKKINVVTKRNIFKITDGMFMKEIEEQSKNYLDIEIKEFLIDNMAQQMVLNPEQFNGSVLTSTNLFMDIISEIAGAVLGSMGLVYSANFGDSNALFEAAHGSTPDLTGKNFVNPAAGILSGAWMAEYLGEPNIKNAVFLAVEEIINEKKYITHDIGGNATTTQMTDAIINKAKYYLRR